MNRFNILYKKSQLTLLLFTLSLSIYSQTQKDTIDTQIVKVVTAYTPSILTPLRSEKTLNFNLNLLKRRNELSGNPQLSPLILPLH